MSRTRDPKLFNYSLTGQVLEEVMDAKYFGVTLSNDLEWSKHIATKTNKANSKLPFLRRNLNGCPEKLKQKAYFSLIRSSMEYGTTVWDPYQKYNSDKVEKVQPGPALGVGKLGSRLGPPINKVRNYIFSFFFFFFLFHLGPPNSLRLGPRLGPPIP